MTTSFCFFLYHLIRVVQINTENNLCCREKDHGIDRNMKRETVDGRVNNIFSDSDSGALLSSMSMLPCEYECMQGCRYYEAWLEDNSCSANQYDDRSCIATRDNKCNKKQQQ
mmetsp:Transcript_18402/g.27589  ORF Transcript_18402/g.27589 Transcript_18402/m.27589 type:complete len:112 (+) Transcript_18402:166-501(+)